MLEPKRTSGARTLSAMLFFALVPTVACSTAARYKKHEPGVWGDSSGYETRVMGEDSYYIVYYLNSSFLAGGMSLRQLRINTFYRAAEVAEQQGKLFFILTNLADYELVDELYTPELREDGMTYLGQVHALTIKVFSSEEDAEIAAKRTTHKFVYNASEVMTRLRPHMVF